MSYQIAKLKKEDLSSLSQIMKEAFLLPPWEEEWSLSSCYQRLEEISSFPSSLGYVLREENRNIGLLLGYLLPYQNEKEFTILEFFIAPDFQHQHLGKLLFDHVKEECIKSDIKKIILNTIYGCEGFYQKLGFQKQEEGIIMEIHL